MERKSGTQRREEIARAVLRIAGERSLAALTTASIAEEVGVTTGALFRHYATLDAMLDAAVAQAVRRIEETIPEGDLAGLDRIVALARNRIRVLGSEPGLAWLVLSDQARLTLPPGGLEALAGLVRRSRRYLLEALEAGMADGTVRNDVAAEDLLVLVVGTIHALVGMSGVHRAAGRVSRRDPETVIETLARLLAPPAKNQRRRIR